jgi:hypothetical protein
MTEHENWPEAEQLPVTASGLPWSEALRLEQSPVIHSATGQSDGVANIC